MRTSAKSPILSSTVGTPRLDNRTRQPQSAHPLYSNNPSVVQGPKPSLIIPQNSSSNIGSLPVNHSSSLSAAYLSHLHNQQTSSHQPQYSVDIDSNGSMPVLHQAPLSGGSTSSGRGSGSRGLAENAERYNVNPLMYNQGGQTVSMQQTSAMVSVSMASPCLVRRTSPSAARRYSPGAIRSREQTPEYSGQEQLSNLEMREFSKPPSGRM